MSFLKRARKEDLISLATNLGENPAPTFSKIDLVSLIQGNKHYNEDDAKHMLETVVTESQERLKMAVEQERLKMATEQERLKIEAENERKERLKMELELEKLRITTRSMRSPHVMSCLKLHQVLLQRMET
ncbi:hypothetical protein AVEN_157581-1 [Araneus ventricosus]|uniref:Uncharacterized protein n=1 Tax=Araneus ventricosus TaxID=182803 RepID=A0A4Y2SIB8_ARAVE|nr:hypothetical protein AVEN_157581-1 [Araneus ventricosus]